MSPEKHHQYLIYFGDSFSSDMYIRDWINNGRPDFQRGFDHNITKSHPSIVAKHFGLRLYNFSFGGKSWWYSRNKFFAALKKEPDLLKKTFAVVFTHTTWDRVNTDRDYITNNLSETDPKLEQAEELYIKHFHDTPFQEWAGEQWFREIHRIFKDIPTVHFHCFAQSVKKNELLPGKKFMTPLQPLSMAEKIGEFEKILKELRAGDDRLNHFNDHNNLALANATIDALTNYSIGISNLELNKFDIPNKKIFDWLIGPALPRHQR